MSAQSLIIAFWGIETIVVTVQIHIANGMPAVVIVGFADKALAKLWEGVRMALALIGFALPSKRIVVNLVPADVLKEGVNFDLLITLGLMVTMGMVLRGLPLRVNFVRFAIKWLDVPRPISALINLISKS